MGQQFPMQNFGGLMPMMSSSFPRSMDRPVGRTLMWKKLMPRNTGDQRWDKYGDDGQTTEIEDKESEVIAVALDGEYFGAQTLLTNEKAGVAIFDAHPDFAVMISRIEELQEVAPLTGSGRQWREFLEAARSVNEKHRHHPISSRRKLLNMRELAKHKRRQRAASRFFMMEGYPSQASASTYAPPPPPPYGHHAPADDHSHDERLPHMDVDETSAGSASEGSTVLRPFRSKRPHPSVFEPLVGLKTKHANDQTGMIVGGNFNENGAFVNVQIDGVPDSEPLQVKTTELRDLLLPNYPNDMITVK